MNTTTVSCSIAFVEMMNSIVLPVAFTSASPTNGVSDDGTPNTTPAADEITHPACVDDTAGSTTRIEPPTGTLPAVVKLTTASSVYAGVSTAGSTRFTPTNKPSVIASVDTSAALSMMLPELSKVVIDVLDPASTCLVGVVTFEIVNTTTVSCSIALPAISNVTLRPSDATTTALGTNGLLSTGTLKFTSADAPISQPSCNPDSAGSTTLIRPPIGTLPAVVKLTSAVLVYAGVSTDVLNVFKPTTVPVATAAVSIRLGPSITFKCLLSVVTVVLYPPIDSRVGVVTFVIVNSTSEP